LHTAELLVVFRVQSDDRKPPKGGSKMQSVQNLNNKLRNGTR